MVVPKSTSRKHRVSPIAWSEEGASKGWLGFSAAAAGLYNASINHAWLAEHPALTSSSPFAFFKLNAHSNSDG